jgi:hypothetical protein
MTTPFTIPHTAQNISDAIGQVVNADPLPASPSTNMVTSQGIYQALNDIQVGNFGANALSSDLNTINTTTSVATSAAIKSYVDNKIAFPVGFTVLGSGTSTATYSGQQLEHGFVICRATTDGNNASAQVTVDGITFYQNASSVTLTLPIRAGQNFSATVFGAAPRVYYKPFN